MQSMFNVHNINRPNHSKNRGWGRGGGGAVENMFETPTYNNSNRTDWLGLFTEYGFQ